MSENTALIILYFLLAAPFVSLALGIQLGYWWGRNTEIKNLLAYLRAATRSQP